MPRVARQRTPRTWRRGVTVLQLGLLALTLFVSAACGATSTPAPPNTLGNEVTVRAAASGTGMPTSTPVPKVAPEKTKDSAATINGLKDTSESTPRSDRTGGDNQAPLVQDQGDLKYPNLGSRLDGLVASVQAGQATAEEAARDAAVHRGASVAVTIHMSGNADEVVAFLEDHGGDPRNVGEDYIEAYVPVTLLGPVSEHPGVIRVREIVPPEPGGDGG